MGFIRNITTGKDNQTHDIVRVAMAATMVSLVCILLLGCGTYVYGYFFSLSHPEAKQFDIQTFFTASSTMAVGISGLLLGGAGSLLLKKTTEPDGTQTTVEEITHGQQPDITRVTQTNVIDPENVVIDTKK